MPLILAMIFTGCHVPHDNHNSVQNPVSADSLFEATGNAKLDSMLQLAATSPQDTALAQLYFKIANEYVNNDVSKAKPYYLKLQALSEQLDWNIGRIWSATCFSLMLSREGLADSAIAILNPVYELAKREKREDWIANIAYYLGVAYDTKSWVNTALAYYMEVLSVRERRNQMDHLEILYYMISEIYNSSFPPSI